MEKQLLEENQPSILPLKMEIECYKCESSKKIIIYILKENILTKIIIFTNSISQKKIYISECSLPQYILLFLLMKNFLINLYPKLC